MADTRYASTRGMDLLAAMEALPIDRRDELFAIIDGLLAGKTTHEAAFTDPFERAAAAFFGECYRTVVARRNQYGDSIFHPLGVFGPSNVRESIGAMLDVKLARIKHGSGENDHDSRVDFCGYTFLDDVAPQFADGSEG